MSLDVWVFVVATWVRRGMGRVRIHRHRHRHKRSVRITVTEARGGGTVKATFRRIGHGHREVRHG